MTLEDHILDLAVPPVLDVLGRFVHLRNARTGTTSMDEGPLKGRCAMRHRDKHMWKVVWSKTVLPKLTTDEDPVIFTFVRNPWDRVCSAFFQCRDRAKTEENKIKPDWDFNSWVKRVLAVQGPGVNMHFAEQHPTAYFRGEQFGFIGRFERMEQDWEELAEMIGVFPSLPHWNAAGHGAYVNHYDDESRDIIGHLYSKDISAFGYEFGK